MATLKVPLIPLSFVVFPPKPVDLKLSDRDLVSFLYTKYLHAKSQKKYCFAGVFLKKDDRDQRDIVSSMSDVYGVGTLVEILSFQYRKDECILKVKGIQRISLKGILPWSLHGCPKSDPQPANHDVNVHPVYRHLYTQREAFTASTFEAVPMKQTPNSDEKGMMVEIETLYGERDAKPEELEALCQSIMKILNDIVLIPKSEELDNYPSKSDPGIWAYELASWTQADPHMKQLVLEESKIKKRLRRLSLLLNEMKLQYMEPHHIEVLTLLNEYKIIHDKCVDVQTVNEAYPKAVRDASKEVMLMRERKYEEYNKCKNYLKMLTSLPWNVLSQENVDMELAKRSLDADLIGLDDVKMEILDFIQGAQGRTLFIHGPSGAGKKSIGKAIARALNRECAMVDMKCMTDVADLSGKTWMHDDGRPGKIVECLKETGTMNPVILLNGVDMAWRRKENNICDALKNLLDKSSFQDSYLGFEVDLSKVLFVCIASDTNNIPDYLHNKLYVIEVTGYFLHEKLEIARKFLPPAVQLVIDDSAIVKLVLEDRQELGVNHLKRKIESIAVSQGHGGFMTVNKENGESYLQGESKRQRVQKTTRIGVVKGLAYDHKSSLAMNIQASAVSGENGCSCTGLLKKTFIESVLVAVFYVKAIIPELNKYWFHIHVSPGETPKDGTSAGIAILTAIMSWILKKPLPQDMAMTGEVELDGTIQPVIGIRQKMIAAEKEDVTCIFLPKGNKDDYEKLPQLFKEGRKVYFVGHCKDVFKELFPEHNDFWNTL